MKLIFLPSVFLIALFLALPDISIAQIEEMCPNLRPFPITRRDSMDNSPQIREQLIKLCIKENKEEYDELVERSEEIEKLSAELRLSFEENESFSDSDLEKLERVEDLIKKVRGELKASDDDDDDQEDPKTILDAISSLQETAADLASEIKRQTRHSISLVAVKSSNTVMRIVKFLRIRN